MEAVLLGGLAGASGEPLAAFTDSAASTREIKRVRRMKERAENPEQLQCKLSWHRFRVPDRVRLCPIIGGQKAVGRFRWIGGMAEGFLAGVVDPQLALHRAPVRRAWNKSWL